jgi:hypothetical protein
MSLLRLWLGALIHAWRGRSRTTIYLGKTHHQTETLRPKWASDDIDVGIVSKQIVYHTVYDRFWIPNVKRVVYEVIGHCPPNIQGQFDPQLFIAVTYPLLCTDLLKWTKYPHHYAINAYLDRLSLYVDVRM